MKIKTLELYTPKLEAQTKFYSKVLGLDVIEKTSNSVVFQIGRSMLKLIYREVHTPYHFAFNIPSNQENEALRWLKERVEIIQYENSDIQYFYFWDAYAIYFYDADGNIAELIARRTLNNPSNQPFSRDSLLEISEMALPTFDIEKEYNILKEVTDISIYSGSVERFCAIGDEHGLFIAINKKLKNEWFPTNDKTESADFKVTFIEKGKVYTFEYRDEKLTAFSKPILF